MTNDQIPKKTGVFLGIWSLVIGCFSRVIGCFEQWAEVQGFERLFGGRYGADGQVQLEGGGFEGHGLQREIAEVGGVQLPAYVFQRELLGAARNLSSVWKRSNE